MQKVALGSDQGQSVAWGVLGEVKLPRHTAKTLRSEHHHLIPNARLIVAHLRAASLNPQIITA